MLGRCVKYVKNKQTNKNYNANICKSHNIPAVLAEQSWLFFLIFNISGSTKYFQLVKGVDYRRASSVF